MLQRRLQPRRQREGIAADRPARRPWCRRSHRRTRSRRTLLGVCLPFLQCSEWSISQQDVYSRVWLEDCGSEDSHARALWALGAVVGRSVDPGRQSLAGDLFHAALPAVPGFTSPRAWAYTLLGIDEYLHAFQG